MGTSSLPHFEAEWFGPCLPLLAKVTLNLLNNMLRAVLVELHWAIRYAVLAKLGIHARSQASTHS